MKIQCICLTFTYMWMYTYVPIYKPIYLCECAFINLGIYIDYMPKTILNFAFYFSVKEFFWKKMDNVHLLMYALKNHLLGKGTENR